MVSILHLLATLVSWIFMIVVSIVSVVGSALLWYTYHELRTGHKSYADTPFLAVREALFCYMSVTRSYQKTRLLRHITYFANKLSVGMGFKV